MADEEKKVSFGFSKTIKKSALKILPKQEEKKVDYIECLDENAIRVVGEEVKKDEELVIPMLGSKTWADRILNKTDADIFESKTKAKENGQSLQIANGSANGVEPMDVSKIKKELPDETENLPKTLEEQAAREIIEDLKDKEIKVEKADLEVPIPEDESLRGEQESTLEDYEQIPIDVFGLAVLRGMGWKPGKGIGKNEKLVAATIPELRPRGMGLGADKLTLQKQNNQPKTKEEEQLKIEKGSFVKVITGKHKGNYGQIEGFDDGAGRLIVKMALSGEVLSLNENVVEPVTKTDYAKNSKVINASKFDKYKNKTQGSGRDSATSDSEASDDRETKSRRAEKSGSSSTRKKSKKYSKRSSDESSDSEHKSRKRRSSSSDGSDYGSKKSRKSKKSHRRESSSERSSKKKSRRRDKERERTRERRAEYPESSDRRQRKKHKRSRSRSPRRR